jgi:hypothetical protein
MKLLSGRFILTVIAGGVFAYVACKQIITAETTAAIISSVFIAYFNRNDRQQHPKPQ